MGGVIFKCKKNLYEKEIFLCFYFNRQRKKNRVRESEEKNVNGILVIMIMWHSLSHTEELLLLLLWYYWIMIKYWIHILTNNGVPSRKIRVSSVHLYELEQFAFGFLCTAVRLVYASISSPMDFLMRTSNSSTSQSEISIHAHHH